jgi:DNA repair protein RecO (recombination protein O)
VIVYTYKTIPYQDSSRLVYAYSETGLISYLARGVAKLSSPLAFAAEPHRMLDVTLSKAALPTLKEATLISRYENAKADLIKTTIHHVIGETLQKNSAPEDDHEKNLRLLQKVLSQIETSDAAPAWLVLYLLKLLYFFGFGLHLKQCSECATTEPLGYDFYGLKTVCEAHGARHEEKENHRLILYYLHKEAADVDIIPLPSESLWLQAIKRLYETHLEFSSHALKELIRQLEKETA